MSHDKFSTHYLVIFGLHNFGCNNVVMQRAVKKCCIENTSKFAQRWQARIEEFEGMVPDSGSQHEREFRVVTTGKFLKNVHAICRKKQNN